MSSNKLKCFASNNDRKCSKILKKVNVELAKKILKFNYKTESDLIDLRICSSCYLYNSLNSYEDHEETSQQESIFFHPSMVSPKPSTSATALQQFSSGNASSTPDSINPSTSESEEETALKRKRTLEMIPELLTNDYSPIYPSRLGRKRNQEKLKTVAENITQILLKDEITPLKDHIDLKNKASLYDEMMEQFKDKYNQLENVPDKIQLLTALPMSLSIRNIQEQFECNRYMVRVSKNLLSTKGAVSKPGPKKGHPLSDDAINKVKNFFEDDDITRIMPGKNDCVSIRVDGEKQTVQKRLLLSTLKESYEEFKKRHKDINIGFSKFSLLKPKYCVQLGSSGTHSVCVCTIHQNLKIMMANINFDEITDNTFKNYKDCISFVLCPAPQPDCYLFKCTLCPGIDALKKKLHDCFEKHDMEDCNIQFNQWVSTDRCNLETLVKHSDDFIEYFADKLKNLIPHHFISSEQSKFVRNMKDGLNIGEFLVCCDFAENYSFGNIFLYSIFRFIY